MSNVLGVVTGHGRSRDALVFIAGRDDRPPGPGANDNGSGTGALVELARTLVGSVTQTSLVFASVDGTTAESAGARELARHPPAGLRLARRSWRCAPWAVPARHSFSGSPARATACLLPAGCGRSNRRCVTRVCRRCASHRSASRSRRSSLLWRTATRRRSSAAARPSSASTVRGPGLSSAIDTSSPSSGISRISLPISLAASARPRNSPRWPSTPGRNQRASARPTSSRATASCADGRWSSSSSPCSSRRSSRSSMPLARARAHGARPSITARRVLWRAAGLAVGLARGPAAGRDGRAAGYPLAAVRRQRARRGAVADRVPARARRRLRRAGGAQACPPMPTRSARGATSALMLAARRRGARLRGQPLPARARDPRPAPLAGTARDGTSGRCAARRRRPGGLARARPP